MDEVSMDEVCLRNVEPSNPEGQHASRLLGLPACVLAHFHDHMRFCFSEC